MKQTILIVSLCFMSTVAFADPNASNKTAINFDKTLAGQLPDGWISGVTGGGSPKWAVEADAIAPSQPNVLKQSGEGTYPWCVKKVYR